MDLFTEQCLNKISILCLTARSYTIENIRNLKELFASLDNEKYNISIIKNWFTLQGNTLSLECLWQLQSNNVVQFTSFLYFYPDSVVRLSEDFEKLIWCQEDDVREEYSECIATLLCVLVNLGGHTPREICKPGQQLLKLIVEKFVDRLLRAPLSVEQPVLFLPHLLCNIDVTPFRLRGFCLLLLRTMVQMEPGAVSVQDAIHQQVEKYTTAGSPASVTQIFQEVISTISVEDFTNELVTYITCLQEQINWCWLLTALSVFVQSSNQGVDSIRGMVEGWVLQACSSKNTCLLASALLVARQCCAESPSKFCTYSTWFGALQIKSASAFTFFIEFLSQIVPYEPVLCLKIHVNKVPSPPPNCHRVIADYVVLAKTRLSDLKQSTDYIGLFGEYTTTEQEGRRSDVAKVLAHFQQTKEVMKIVLEASVFRRQFYEEVFLTELLSDSNRDHAELIEKLYSLGKIPHGIYNRWRNKC